MKTPGVCKNAPIIVISRLITHREHLFAADIGNSGSPPNTGETIKIAN
ncbi:hypothetical protein CHISP_0014 [Chitinispirillum alkaliphilum]|nr:hypothetical protein CHISP_0014 [Chitinispirillum alkaliphilum]